MIDCFSTPPANLLASLLLNRERHRECSGDVGYPHGGSGCGVAAVSREHERDRESSGQTENESRKQRGERRRRQSTPAAHQNRIALETLKPLIYH